MIEDEAQARRAAEFQVELEKLREAWRRAGYGVEDRLLGGASAAALSALEHAWPLCWDLRELWRTFGGTREGGRIRERWFFPGGMLLSPQEAIEKVSYVGWDDEGRTFVPFMEDGAGGYWVQTFDDGGIWYASGEMAPVQQFQSILELLRVQVVAYEQGVVAVGASGLEVDHPALHQLIDRMAVTRR